MRLCKKVFKGLKVAIIAAFLVCYTVSSVTANHIVGGDLNLTFIVGDRYRLQVNLYFDNVNGGLEAIGSEALVGVFSKRTNQQITFFSVPYRSGLFLPYSREECRVLSNSITRHFYELEVILAAGVYTDTAGYYMVYERCCRNVTAANILNAQNTGMVFYLEFPSLLLHRGYSTPVMPLPITDPVCLGRLFQMSSKAFSNPSDSIVYDFVRPLAGNTSRIPPIPTLPVPLAAPYAPVTWASALYSDSQPAPGNPALSVHPQTGLITFRPLQQGVFLFTIRMRHYRSGKKLGEVRRDFQMRVSGCPSNAAPEGFLYRSQGQLPLLPTDTILLKGDCCRCFVLRVADLSEPDRIRAYVAFNPLQLPIRITPGEQTTNGIRDTAVFSICLSDCRLYPDTVIRLGIGYQDNSCPKAEADTAYIWIRSSPPVNVQPTLSITPDEDTIRLKAGTNLPLMLIVADTADPQPGRVYLSGKITTGAIRSLLPEWRDQSGEGIIVQNVSIQTNCALASTIPYKLSFFATDSSCFQESPIQKSLYVYVDASDGTDIPFALPNVVTPNGDGLNDYFFFEGSPNGSCDPAFKTVTITNRWGRKVYTSSDPGFRWDPSNLPAGVYFAILSFESRQYTTAVTILK